MANTNENIPATVDAPGFKLTRVVSLEVHLVVDVDAWELAYGVQGDGAERLIGIDDNVLRYVEGLIQESSQGRSGGEGGIVDVEVFHP